MFTGLVEEIGHVSAVKTGTEAIQISIRATRILQDLTIGDSIAVNGACLTVTEKKTSGFTADVMPETIKSTALKTLKSGDPVNLERAMRADGRFGGHFVTGHVDGVGRIVRSYPKGNARYLIIKVPAELDAWLVEKGSVALDGTSLTVFAIQDARLTVALIPHTSDQSVLGQKKMGDSVNVECDVLQKYVMNAALKTTKTAQHLTYGKLLEHGFISH
ncbi:riboflavin synthase [Sporolactobacillus sp. THM19-2]|uniref:riboflavin synthase n=1 Tax=Sporolactobacillus sp. THM19-2 TaxID=2511171 RepID=UPI001020272F|nr:riboflavin synthase [Sporolactobacillus sp. THM19-2]RYL92572.1 riboflavin synthase [Sporolactobacillus sp. THM19-2]